MKMKRTVAGMIALGLVLTSPISNVSAKERAEEEVKYTAFYEFTSPPDQYYDKQWAFNNDGSLSYVDRPGGKFGKLPPRKVQAVSGIDIDLEGAFSDYNGGKRETIVAIIDTGVDFFHEDLQNILWINKNEIPDNGIDDDGNGYIDDLNGWNFYDDNNVLYKGDFDTHGTHVAGTIIANINSIGVSGIVGNSKVKVMVLKALGGEDESGYTSSIADAIKYAEDNGAVICNLSFGTKKQDKYLREAIASSKMLFVVASGNGTEDLGVGFDIEKTPVYPASYPFSNIISVANLQCDGTLHVSSNFGKESVDIAAPGSKILSTLDTERFFKEGFTAPYSYQTGTSMAVPMVVGVAAMLYSEFPGIRVEEIKTAILDSARYLPSLEGLVKTSGLLNANQALYYCRVNYAELLKRRLKGGEKEQDPSQGGKPAPQKEKEEKLTVKGKGSFPVIRFKQIGKRKLLIRVTDKDKDLLYTRYSEGKKKRAFFVGGKSGKKVKLSAKGTRSFTLKKGKQYTFYAVDKKGNETVLRIRLK